MASQKQSMKQEAYLEMSEGRHIGILTIRNSKDFRIEKIRLKTVRPFVMDEVVLKEVNYLRPTDLKGVNDFLVDKVIWYSNDSVLIL